MRTLILTPLLAAACLTARAGGRVVVEGPATASLGVFRDDETPAAVFTLRNVGDGPLRVTGLHLGCGCAEASSDRESVPPGGAASVRVVVTPFTLEGAFSKTVLVTTDPPGAGPLALTLSGTCAPLFTVRPGKRIDAGRVPPGAAWEGAFELEASGPAAFGAPSVEATCPASASVEPAPDGERRRWRVAVRAEPPPGGAFRCRVDIPVTAPAGRPPVTLEASGRPGPQLFAVPSAIALPPGGERRVRLRLAGNLRRPLAPGEVSVSPETPGLSLRPLPGAGDGLTLAVSAAPSLLARLAGEGPLALTLSVPGAAPATLTLKAAPPAGAAP